MVVQIKVNIYSRDRAEVTGTMSGGRSSFLSVLKLPNLRAVLTKRDAPSASGSAPDDWVLSALDIARRAAIMADDLEHVPSIKGIADIFTQMLERLQVSLTSCSACVMSSFFKGN